jgi:hypothetical protein
MPHIHKRSYPESTSKEGCEVVQLILAGSHVFTDQDGTHQLGSARTLGCRFKVPVSPTHSPTRPWHFFLLPALVYVLIRTADVCCDSPKDGTEPLLETGDESW